LNDFPIPFYFAAFLIHLELFFIFNIFPKHFLNRFVCFFENSTETEYLFSFKSSREAAYQEGQEAKTTWKKNVSYKK